MEFRLDQYTDDIDVFKDEILFLKVRRKFNWRGVLSSKFYKGEQLIFESLYNIFLFQKFLSIKYQSLEQPVSLFKKKGIYYLQTLNSRFSIKRHYIKNPVYTLFINDIASGEVKTKLTTFNRTPIVWHVEMKCNDADSLYLLIRLLMELPPVMDV